jgi:acyl transferase domain-containing protein/NADP-dependent 3-hydroxy acid dehydrogenase YdfG
MSETAPSASLEGIAIIGMAVRFPGADSVEAFWRNLRDGVESITFFSDDELIAAGVEPATLADPRYVKANGVLADADRFDAAFFGMTPREAELTDPQHRVFLEVAWEAMERAGYDSASMGGRVGVFAGAGLSTYLVKNLAPNRAVVESAGELALLLGNNKDFAPTRASYKLNLRGPSVSVNTACSTSLVATHLACQSLLDFHCDMALAGGVSVQVPQVQGYLHAEGGIGSPDGHCRAFDAQARGTVSGSGVGLVVLKRLADALADGDTIHAVIRGSAVNNDGSEKIGFTAPSVDGQSVVIAEAQAVAGVAPGEVSYIEAHGTGTELGDPIEVAALTQVFAGSAAKPGACALGSVKTNFGHLDEAAGVAGLVKTVLALEHGEIPPSLHFTAPNPKIDFAGGLFRVNAQLTPWPVVPGAPRRAGVSSFGIGGTNAHLVLEEAPALAAGGVERPWQLLVWSARTETALVRMTENLRTKLVGAPCEVVLSDAAYTLAVGRRAFAHRQFAVVQNGAEVGVSFATTASGQIAADKSPEVVFLFSGQGSQYPGMLAGLYASEPVVRETVDKCAEILRPHLGFDLRAVLDPAAPDAAARLRRTAVAQPALFVADYALAKLWQNWGVKPAALLGHSLGEYVAACLAGVYTLEAALELVAARGALMDALPAGAMLAVALSENEATALAAENGLALAAVNAPGACVLSGPIAAIERIATTLAARGVVARRLETSHAFHSAMMEPMLAAFVAKVRAARPQPPSIPIVSNVTGDWLTATEATEAEYWTRHLRQTVRFSAGVDRLRVEPARLFLEVGPGRALASMVQRSLPNSSAAVITSARHAEEGTDDLAHVLTAAGKLWCAGVKIDWARFYSGQSRRRVVLPTYPFERHRYWIDAVRVAPVSVVGASEAPPTRAWFDLGAETRALTAMEAQLGQRADLTETATYAAFAGELDGWCAARVMQYFAAMIPAIEPGRRQRREDLRTGLGVIGPLEKFLGYFLQVLAANGDLRIEGDEVTWLRAPASGAEVEARGAALQAKYPEFRGIVKLVEHCTAHYREALNGEVPAITVIYPEGRSDLLESLTKETARHTNKDVYIGLLKEAIERRLAAADGQRLRILEVGVGDGLLAGRIAPGLKGRNVDYVATDLSRAFVMKAETKAAAAGLDFLSFAVLDIARDPVAQDFTRGSFDFIIGLDVVHATRRLGETLGHLRTLLAPGGMFGIVEKVRTERWVDLVWGLAEGWWYFEDTELRQHTPLLPADGWERLLRGMAFSRVSVFPEATAARATTDYALLLAQVPRASTAETTPPVTPKRDVDLSKWFYTPTWRESLRPAASASRTPRRYLLLGGDEGVGDRLAARLTSAGGEAVVASVGAGTSAEEFRKVIAAQDRPPQHVVWLGFATADRGPYAGSFFELLHLAQALSGSCEALTLTLLSSGAWAVEPGETLDPERALLVGPLRVIPLELPQITVRNLDVAQLDDAAIGQLAVELGGAGREPVVAFRRGVRWVQTITPTPLPEVNASATGLRERGVYVITGGLGSMGLAFAKELARAARARLVLVGRKPPSPVQLRTVAELEASGAQVMCVQANVADPVQMRTVAEQARARFGGIHGVIHTAGVYGQGVIWDRSRRESEAVLAPKLRGGRVLEEIFGGEKLDFLVLCASLASVRPEPGQVDYCAANAFLDAFAADFTRRTGTRAISISWGMWQELGMMDHAAIAPAQRQAVRDEIAREGWGAAGVAAFRRILAHGQGSQIIVSPQSVRLTAALSHPWLTERIDEPGRVTYLARLQPSRHWVVDEHRLEGQAILPGTAYLELARAAAADHRGVTAVELREVYFLSPMWFDGDEVKDVRVVLQGDAFHILSRVGGDAWLEHTRGEAFAVVHSAPTPLTPPSATMKIMPVPPDAVRFGPRWRNLRTIAFGDNEGVAELALAEEWTADVSTTALHPALLDMATGFITVRYPLPDSLPFMYRRLVAHRPLPACFRSQVRLTASNPTTLEMAATLTDENGHLLVEIEGYCLRRAVAPAPRVTPDNVRLLIGNRGALDSLALAPATRRAPGPGEVEIQIEAAGLNFIEVLYALGMLPAAPELESSFGLECAGRIARVGEGVTEFAIGEPVVAYANGCFAAFVTTAAGAVTQRPAGLSASEAATMPAAFATAHYALVTQARLVKSERILIHAAAGGVGQAAVQIARHLGAEIFATAGSPEKRAALKAAGVAHVMDSRSLAFADEIKKITGGRGVDVVLNSLGGEFMSRSLELVAPHGRFLELGKRDLFKGGTLNLRPFAKIISFIVIDVGPDLPGFAALWSEVTARMHAGVYRPLPHTDFSMSDAGRGFDYMARAKHLGKVVLTLGDPAALLAASRLYQAPPMGRTLGAILGESPTLAVAVTPAPAASPNGHQRPELATAYLAPGDEIERAVAGIWQELLGLERVGVLDNFFDLRGDSLLAAQVMARLHASQQVKLPLSALFDEPTVAGLSKRVRAARGVVRTMQASPVAARGADEEEGEI